MVFCASQVAILALSSNTISSELDWECLVLGKENRVALWWAAEYSAISNDEKTNLLAKKAATTSSVGPELFCGIRMSTHKKELRHRERQLRALL